MNDYKELIGDIGDCLIAHPSETVCKRVLQEAADAIERLVKERDAAVAEIPKHCNTCGCFCWDKDCVECKWKWRGVREDNDEID